MLFNLLIWVFFGALAGWIASAVLLVSQERDENFEYIGAGVLGAVLGGVLFRTLGSAVPGEFSLIGLFFAISFATGSIVMIYKLQNGNNEQRR